MLLNRTLTSFLILSLSSFSITSASSNNSLTSGTVLDARNGSNSARYLQDLGGSERASHSSSKLIQHKRRKHHAETRAEDQLRSPELASSTDRKSEELIREKRLLLNSTNQGPLDVTDSLLKHPPAVSSNESTQPTTRANPANSSPKDPAKIEIKLTTTTTTTKPTSNYDLSNSTDPYAFSTESHSFALPVGVQVLMCILYGTLAFTAITSNMIVCYIVLSNQRMRTATNYFIVNLAVGDILMALLCIPFTFPANLVFQYWPFGLFLCVVVSYSQTNSVFISAYTMVAISIDKYLAIMYPMRIRMTKTQSKTIILVIWSAALITSLPTAILSRLSPAFVDLSTTDSVPVNSSNSNSSVVANQFATNMADSNKSMSSIQTTANGSSEPKLSREQEEQFTWQNKYFCQESWLFWPRGKYYYSMALMVLQFVLPLFVLVITYSRIVIVVWGKRIPGEEDNARDARMARSKRKVS